MKRLLSVFQADGNLGLKRVKECGGLTIVQDPETAAASMRHPALRATAVDYVLSLPEIGSARHSINGNEKNYGTEAVSSRY
ncbi:MAG: hypothetical protein GY801_03480 [bacterium]|nr:hypothetical protein [bacterium]